MSKTSNVLTLIYLGVNTKIEENRTQFWKEVVNTGELTEEPTSILSLGVWVVFDEVNMGLKLNQQRTEKRKHTSVLRRLVL